MRRWLARTYALALTASGCMDVRQPSESWMLSIAISSRSRTTSSRSARRSVTSTLRGEGSGFRSMTPRGNQGGILSMDMSVGHIIRI